MDFAMFRARSSRECSVVSNVFCFVDCRWHTGKKDKCIYFSRLMTVAFIKVQNLRKLLNDYILC